MRDDVNNRYDTMLRGGEPDTSKAGAEFSIIAYDGTPCKIRISDNGRGGALMTHDGRVAFDIIDDAGNMLGSSALSPRRIRDMSHKYAVQERIDAERGMMQQAESQQGATPASAAQPFTVGQSLTLSDGQGGVVRGDVIDDADENGRITVALDNPMPDGSETLLLSPEELQGMVVQDVENGQENVGTEEEGGSGERKVNVSATPASDRVPRGKNGELHYENVDADIAWDALVEQCQGDAAMAQRVAQQMVRSRKDALDKVKKKGADKADTPEQAIAAERAYANLLSAAEKSLGLWQDISAVQSRREQEASEKKKEQERASTNDMEEEREGNDVKLPEETEERDENENAPLHQQEQQHAAADATDAQGNPVNPDGTLKLEKITSVDELTDEDFSNPTRNVELPALPENVDKAIVANGKPVVIKKNIFEKNKRNHSELSPSKSRSILKEALYFTNLYGRTQPKSRPNYWVAIRTSERNKLVVLEVSEKKDNVEIVGWRYAGERQIEELRKQAEREDGQLLILTSTKEAAAGLSTLPSDVSNDKDTQATSDVQAPASENSENAVDKEEDKFKEAVTSLLKALQQEGKTDEEIERDVRSLLETFSKPTLNGIISSYLASLNTKNPQHLKALSRLEQALKGMGITVKQGASGIAAGDVAFTSAYDEPFTWYTVQSAHTTSAIKQQKDRINSLVATASNQSLTPTERANALNELRATIPHYAGKFEQDGQFFDDRVSINEYLRSIEEIKIEGKDKTLPRFKINGYYRVKKPRKKKAAQGKEDKQANDVQSAVSVAEEDVNTSPTEAQKEAGNYKKGHVRIDGFNVTIENPKGSVRRGTDASGKQWEQEMHNTYGYIRGTEGVDGDHIDVFFSDDPSQGDVFVVDQVNKDGSFDEHKVMYGFASEEEARKAYLSNYEDGWTGLGAITPVSKEEFKKWVQSSRRKTKPFAEYKGVKALDAATAKTDSQGNPLNEDGTLNLDRVASVDELTDEDFSNPTRNVELPALPENVDKAIGANGKPVIIKKNIFARNAERHADLTADESRNILESALYNPNLYGQNQKTKRPYNWVVINTKDKEGNNRLVLLELSPKKENVEIVHWHYLRDESIETIKRQAEREGGHILILPSETEEAGGLSSRTLGLSSDGKVTEAQADVQAPAGEKSQEGQADSAMLYHKEADGAADAVTSEEAALRDALMGKLQAAGIEVVTDAEEAQRVLDDVNADQVRQQKLSLHYYPRLEIKPVRGEWTKSKIIKRLKDLVGARTGYSFAAKRIAEFDSAEELAEHMFYHGTQFGGGRLKPSILMSDSEVERIGGGGYGKKYWGISVSRSKRVASNFSTGRGIRIYPIILVKNAKVKEMPELGDAVELEDYIEDLWKEGVDAVWIGDKNAGEQELCVLNPAAIVNIDRADVYKFFKLGTSENPLHIIDENGIEKLYQDAKRYVDALENKPQKPQKPSRFLPAKDGDTIGEMKSDEEYQQEMSEYEQKLDEYNNSDEVRRFKQEDDYASRNIRFFRTPDGHAYGFTVGGKIYIDPRIAKADTPIHEYTHLWSAAMRQGDAKAWADIVRLMQGTPLWDEVAQNYSELADDVDALAEEVLSHFSGRRGAERLREAQRAAMEQEGLDAQAAAVAAVERVRQALKRFWRKVADFFGRRFTTAEEVADTVLADMLHGVKPAFDAKDGGVRYDANSEEAGIVARAKADGTYMKAPNGQPSKLTPRQWVQVRTKAFKEWFGDWAKAARIEKLRKSEPIVRKGDEYKGKYELNSRSAEDYVIHSLRGEYPNNDTGDVIRITRASRKVAHHDAENEVHLRSIAYIPEMIKNAVFIEESPNEKGSKFDSYRYYVVGLKIGGVDYTAKLVVGVKDGDSYYDHSLTEIEKNNLIDLTNGVKADVSGNEDAPFTGKDKRLLSILQTNSSKVVDENGEPRVVYHGTQEEFNAFNKDAVRERGDGVKGFFFAPAARRESVAGYYAQHGGSIMPVFLNLKRPLVLSTSENLEAPGIADGYDGIISTAASDSESRYYDYEQKRVATERLNKGDIVEIVAFEPSQIKSAEENVGTFDGSNPDIRYQKSTDLFSEYGDRWLLEQTNDDGRHTTQVTTTIQSYKKFSEFVKRDSRGAEVDVLDASSGLGHGTEWMRSNGMRVDDVEPYPSSNRKKPTYSSYDDVKKKYDYIISNAVLNVIPDDWRSDLLHNMADKLKPGGKLVINVRGAESIRRQGKDGVTRITLDDASEILVLRPDGSIKAYQKGFTKDELQAWCEDELGEGYTVLKANKENAGGTYDTAVVVIKNNESTTKGSASELGQPTDKGAAVANFGAMIGNNSERSKRLSDLSLEISKTGALGSHQLLHGLNVALDLSVTTKEGGRMSTDRSRYYDLGGGVSLRVSDHQGNADTFARVGHPVDNYGIVIKLSRSRFKDKDGVDYLEYVYYGDRVDGRRRQMEIVDGLRAFVETGDFSKLPRADKVNGSGRFKDAALPQQTERSSSAKRLVVEELAEKLHTNIYIIDDVNEITHPNAAVQERRRKSKGWYDMRTGQVYIVLPNNSNVEDVADTVFLETVGHKGLRELIGDDNYNDFLREVYGHVKVDVRRRIAKLASKHNWDFDKATDEYLSGLSEKGFEDFDREERSVWQWLKEKVLKAIDKFLGSLKLPKWVKLGDNELRYMLWRSKERLERGKEHPIDLARDIVKREELGIGEDYAVYRDPDETLRNAAERAADEAGMDVLLREGEEDAASDTSGEQMQGGVAATRDALRARALQEHAVHQQDFQRKLDAIGRQMGKLRQALAAQRAYDKSTVGILSGLARTMLKLGMLDKMSPSEESRLLTLINAANGKADLTKEVDDLFDLMTKNLLRVSTARLHFRQRQMRACRYAEGVLPVCDLKKRTKCWGYSKPRRWLMRVMVSASSFSNCWAWARRWSAMMSLAVRPVSTRTKFPKYPLDRQHLSAK